MNEINKKEETKETSPLMWVFILLMLGYSVYMFLTIW